MQAVHTVMTAVPIMLREDHTLADAAREMVDNAVGAVMVVRDGALSGLITDRDIVIRAIAEGRDPAACLLRDFCSRDLVTVRPDDDIATAVQLMRDRGVRRIPVAADGLPAGMVSLGDIVATRREVPALAEISTAPPDSTPA